MSSLDYSGENPRLHRMDRADYIVSQIFNFVNIFAVMACAVILLVTVANVVMRAFFDAPINGAFELSTDMMVMVSYCSLPIVTLLSEHIGVDLVAGKLPKPVQSVLKVINLVLYSVLCVYASYATFIKGAYEKQMGTCGSSLYIPYYIFYNIIGVMLLVSVACALYNIVHICVTGSEMQAGMVKEYSKKLKLSKKRGGEAV